MSHIHRFLEMYVLDEGVTRSEVMEIKNVSSS